MITNRVAERELELLYREAEVLFSARKMEKAMNQFNTIINKAKKCNSIKYLGNSLALKGMVYYGMNEFKLAIDNYQKAIGHYAQNVEVYHNEIKQINNSLGILYKNIGEYRQALECLFDSIEISEKFGIHNSIAYNNIATIYLEQKDYKKALSYYQKAIELENSSNEANRTQVIKYLANIASLYIKIGNYEEADKIYKKTHDYCKENNEFEAFVGSLKGLAILSIEKKDLRSAELLLNRALNLSENINYKAHLIDLNLYLADVYENTNRPSLQLGSLNNALKIAQKSFKSKEMLVLENIHDYYYIQGNLKDAYEVLKKMFSLNKKNFLKEKEENILQLQEKFESEQKDKLIKQEQAFSETLKEKNAELASLNDDLAQFNHGVSHDLKEPIRLVKGRLVYLQSIAKDNLSLQELESLEIAQKAAERMEKMLEDLHRFSTLGSNLKDMRDVDLNEVLAIVQADLQMRIRENDVKVSVMELPIVSGYKIMYVQLFQNLINNAIKFRREGVESKINVRYRDDENWHYIDVQDNGVGIKEENLPQVFKLFKRIKETEYKEGSGVGLSIVQKIAKKMQGEISLASEYGSSTTFTLKLPKN